MHHWASRVQIERKEGLEKDMDVFCQNYLEILALKKLAVFNEATMLHRRVHEALNHQI